MWSYTVVSSGEDYLAHHGILGMHWGIRRFQNEDGSLTSAGRMQYCYDENRKHSPHESDNVKKSGLSEKQKKAIAAGAAVAATVLVAYGGYKLYQSGKLDSLITAGKNTVKGIDPALLDESKNNAIKRVSESVSDTVKSVNPSRSSSNCYNCVVGTLSRLLGYDVVAKGDTQNGKGLAFGKLCEAFGLNEDSSKDVQHMMDPTTDRLERYLARKFKDGDVGALGIEFNDVYRQKYMIPEGESLGHVLNWIVKDGTVQFADGQVGSDNVKSVLEKWMSVEKEAEIAKLGNIAEGFVNGKSIEDLLDFGEKRE